MTMAVPKMQIVPIHYIAMIMNVDTKRVQEICVVDHKATNHVSSVSNVMLEKIDVFLLRDANHPCALMMENVNGIKSASMAIVHSRTEAEVAVVTRVETVVDREAVIMVVV